MIMQMKLNFPPNFMGGLLNKFTVILDHTCTLGFKEKPDYNFLCNLLHDLCTCEGHQYDQIFNWCLLLNTYSDDQSLSAKITNKNTDFEKDDSGTNHSSHCV